MSALDTAADRASVEEVVIPSEPYHDQEEEDEERPTQSEGEEEARPSRSRLQSQNSYEASVVSTQSSPPPYELYPPAKTVFGRMFNWLRKIPRLNTHQAIYLPTLPVHNNNGSSGRSIFSIRRRNRRDEENTGLSTTSSHHSSVDSSSSVSCWSYYYYTITDRLPKCPRILLPSFLAQHRLVLILVSFFSLALFSFLLFCSIFFSPADYPSPIFPDKVTNSSARFLTLNIFMRPPLIKNNWSDYKDDRLAYIEKYILPEYDVITFQESFAFATRRKDHLITTARNLGYNYHLESPRKYPWQLGVDGGLLLISRFPIRESHIIEYPRGQHSDWLSIKGALHALIELNPERKLHIYTTHTQASYDTNNVINEEDTMIRLSQFSLLHNFVYDTTRNDDEPIMVVGDLNVDAAVHNETIPITQPSKSSSPEYEQMVEVIKGTGVKRISSNQRWFEHHWKMEDLKDVVHDHYTYHPVTFGDYTRNEHGDLIPAETVLTNWDQLMTVQSIDRIFWSDRNSNRTRLERPQVEKFWVKDNTLMTEEERQNTEFTQISDHYGISCEIIV
ncbi:Endonuclease/exonuclease/phosphatase [Mucor mucedo]|uniref:Endonuclease/exonuclease/phosphatase n=1 Tax=Mucor mucedo TaxID=29922 RepID=UPI0022205B23|nr:Endonuclease/exonuclease/phosphatase [Mucor mucedo]KAI7891600.1 Endonuclease/exonuclease/phosphatase [Mucor mucedo]